MAISELHLGVLLPGCAESHAQGVAASWRSGPLVEAMTELVAKTTVMAYEAPVGSADIDDQTDYVMRPKTGEIELLSLGPRGTYRDFMARRARVRSIVEAESHKWDLLFLPLVNRRVGLVFNTTRCSRIISQIGGYTPSVIAHLDAPWYRKVRPLLASFVSEHEYHKVARNSLFFVNGEALVKRYSRGRSTVDICRSSARRADQRFVASDRFTSDAPNILVISRLTAPKGVFEAIDTFATVRATIPGARLHVVGAGDAVPEMKELAARRGVADSVDWYGWVPPGQELFELIKQMDVMVTLSMAESLPKTIWECMSHSVLVVATPVGALPHVFAHNEDVVFVPTKNPSAAADAILRLANDPPLRQKLIARGLETSADVTVERVAEHLLRGAAERWPELRGTGRFPETS